MTVEEVARDKLVAELLDRVCDRGYLRIGDLRDAIARNRLKLGDTWTGFVAGDALLRGAAGSEVTLLVDDEVAGTRAIPALAGDGASSQLEFPLASCEDGRHALVAVADSGAAVLEADERDNAVARQATFDC